MDRLSIGIALALAATPGCYASHLAGRDGGAPGDAGPRPDAHHDDAAIVTAALEPCGELGTHAIAAIASSRDGSRIAYAVHAEITVLDARTGAIVATLGPPGSIGVHAS